MRVRARLPIGLLLLAVIAASGAGLMLAAVYGSTIFVIHPILPGALAYRMFPHETNWGAIWRGACAVVSAGLLAEAS